MEVAFTADGVGDVLLEPSGILFHRHEDNLIVSGGEPLRHNAAVGLAGLRLLGPCAVDVRGDVGDACWLARTARASTRTLRASSRTSSKGLTAEVIMSRIAVAR